MVVNRCLRDLGHRQHPLDEDAVADAEPNIYEFLWFPDAAKKGCSLPSEGPEKGGWDGTATQTEKNCSPKRWRPTKDTGSPRTDATGKPDAN